MQISIQVIYNILQLKMIFFYSLIIKKISYKSNKLKINPTFILLKNQSSNFNPHRKMYKYLYPLLFFPVLMLAQTNNSNTIKRSYYKDKVVSVEIWSGNDKKPDSLKTYYSNGKLNEVFYFDDKGYRNSNGYQYNKQGEKLVTWNFSHGKLLSRTDHKLPFNKDSEEVVKKMLQSLTELNKRTNYNPTKIGDLFERGRLRARLGNTILALEDLKRVDNAINKISKNTTKVVSETAKVSLEKIKSLLYDLLANIYLTLEMENYASQYFYKAMAAAPSDTRILFNFANYLQIKKSTDLAFYYLKKVVAEKPKHGFARWSLAILYSDAGDYQKAMDNISIAFNNEKSIINHSTDYGGRDLRTTRGLLYHKLGETEKGIKDLKDELEMDKNNSYAMKNLGIIYLDQKKYNEACKLFQKAKELDYTLTYDEKDLDALLESACNNVQHEIAIEETKPFVFPNPATTVITVKNYDFKKYDYELFDFESSSVLRGNSPDGSIDISKLNSGFYILKILNNNSPQTFKIIKE